MDDKDLTAYDDKYLPGATNRAMRYYFYLTKGVDILNQFRNLFLAIGALYFALHLENIWWLVGMTIPAALILLVVGYINVHYLSKVTEWLNLRFGTHYGIKQFNYMQGQFELLTEIRDLLKKDVVE